VSKADKVCQKQRKYDQGIAELDYWIAQSGLHSNLVDWIVIDNPKSNSDFGFGLSILFLFQSKSKISELFFQEIEISLCIMLQQGSTATYFQNFQTINLSKML